MKKILTLIAIITALTSCSNYYKAITIAGPSNASAIEDLKNKNKYFILRSNNNALAMSNLVVTPDKTGIQCNLDTLPAFHRVHLMNATSGKMKYRKETTVDNETVVLNEAHIYISDTGIPVTGPYSFAFDKVQKTEVLEKDKIKTQNRHVTTGLIVVAGIGLLLAGVGALVFAGGIF